MSQQHTQNSMCSFTTQLVMKGLKMRFPYCHTPVDPEISRMAEARINALTDKRKREVRRELYENKIPFRPKGCSCGKCDIMEYDQWIIGDETCNTELNFFWNPEVFSDFEKFIVQWKEYKTGQTATE